ncbi:hypothetical protein RIF29_00261 [Crotalaria pallida]|uniref:Ribonuclease H n=1 Tax=Crotalaria pallida TaxID=3830 RepID=A0AAN9IVP2_CROPI
MGRFYVVFEGLNPGVYRSWDECEQQIHGVSGNKHKSFSTEEEANEEFRKYQLKKKRCAQPQEKEAPLPPPLRRTQNKSKMEFADLLVYENDLLGASMESWLRRFTFLLTKTEPTFIKESSYFQGGKDFCRYYVCTNSCLLGDKPFCIGRYAETEFLAREDASILMIRMLLAATNKEVFDYNYHNLKIQEELMDSLQAHNWELMEENKRLKEEVHVLRERFCSLVARLFQKRVSTLEEHDSGHLNAIKLLELIVLKKKDVVDGEKASVGDEARNVINNDPIHNDSDLNVMGGHSSPGIDFPPELTANFILQVSDEEGGSGHMNTMSTPNLKLGKLYGDSGAPRSSKRRQNAMPDELGSMGKRLFPSPTSNRQTPMQRPPRSGGGQSSKSSQIQSPAFASKSNSVSNVSSQAKQNTRQRSVSIPRVMKTMFKAPGDINFNLSEAMMFAFIFGDDMDLCEPLVTMGDLRLWRLDFLNFVPGKEIKVTISSKYSNVSVQIFTVYAMKVALTQKYYSFVTTWHLPPSFAVDLKLGKNTSEMLEIYKDTSMHLSNDLRFIYVPIMEDDHWYLTVISMRDSTAYHADSYLRDCDIPARRLVIRGVCEALYKMMSSDEFGSSAVYCPFDLDAWPIDIARGVPNMGTSVNSSVWVLQWMLMEEMFVPNLPGVWSMHEKGLYLFKESLDSIPFIQPKHLTDKTVWKMAVTISVFDLPVVHNLNLTYVAGKVNVEANAAVNNANDEEEGTEDDDEDEEAHVADMVQVFGG